MKLFDWFNNGGGQLQKPQNGDFLRFFKQEYAPVSIIYIA